MEKDENSGELKQYVFKYQLFSNYQFFYIDVFVYDFRQDIRFKFD